MKFAKLILIFIAFLSVSEANAENTNQVVETWTDTTTGLIWMVCPYSTTKSTYGNGITSCDGDSSSTMKWSEAVLTAEKLNSQNYAGHNDWRIPSVAEFNTIYGCDLDNYKQKKEEIEPSDFRIDFSLPNLQPISSDGDNFDYGRCGHEKWNPVFDGKITSWTSTLNSKQDGNVWDIGESGFESTSLRGNGLNYLMLVRGGAPSKSYDKILSLAKNLASSDAKEAADAKAAHEKLIADREKAASDQAVANTVYNAKLVEARKHLKRGDTVIYRDQQAMQAYTVLVLGVEPDTGMVQIQLRNGDAIYVRSSQVDPYVK